MSAEKKRWILLCVFSISVAVAAGVLIHLQREKIATWQTESETLRGQISANRALIKGTPDLVREVIIQRESDAVIKGILSDEEDINNFVRTLQEFAEESSVSITAVTPKRDSTRGQSEEFKRVAYGLDIEADAFEFLDFLDEVETHERFMSVSAFDLTSGARNLSANEDELPRHKIKLSLETYVYRPKEGAKEVSIDQYERKRESLVGEIARRAKELEVPRYDYKGRRARRDPWIDPRIDITVEEFVPIEDQNEVVANLIDMVHEAEKLLIRVEEADNYIAEMKADAALEERLIEIEAEILRVQSENVLSYLPAERRFQVKVVKATTAMRERRAERDQPQDGPSIAALQQAIDSMRTHIKAHEYELAREVFDALSARLIVAEQNEFKRPLIDALKELDQLVDVILEFEAIDISISGIAIYEGLRPVALINGASVTEGELLEGELIVRHIRPDHVEFDYRGVRLARTVNAH